MRMRMRVTLCLLTMGYTALTLNAEPNCSQRDIQRLTFLIFALTLDARLPGESHVCGIGRNVNAAMKPAVVPLPV